jgi:oxidoreductase
METLEAQRDAFAGADVVFCTLGTTRSAAGSAANMKRVDVDYVDKAAAAAKAANVPHFSLLTSQGANKNVWYSEHKLFHGCVVRCVVHLTAAIFVAATRG